MIKVMKGRYGPYVSDGDTNATLPREMDPLTVTLDQAVALIAERIAKGGGKKPKRARAAAKPKGKPKAGSKKANGKKADAADAKAADVAPKAKPKPKAKPQAKPKRKPAPVDGG
jgi:DNA topoisomerase-1